jgi:hypothetical protein
MCLASRRIQCRFKEPAEAIWAVLVDRTSFASRDVMISSVSGGMCVEILSSLRRQWILACFLLLVTLAGTAYALVKIPWTYEAKSSVVFLIPAQQSKSFDGNPYLGFSESLNETADVVRYEVMDITTVNLLAAHGYTSTYLVADAIDTPGPVLDVTVTGKNKAITEHTLYGVTSEITTKLSELQGGIASSKKIRDLVITYTPQATRLASKKARPLTVVVGLGLILTVGIPVLVDAAYLRRRNRRKQPRGEGRDGLRNRPEVASRQVDRDYAGTPMGRGRDAAGQGERAPH